jgi:hypothetical protein
MNGDNPLGFTLGNYNPQHPVRKLRHGGQPMLQIRVILIRFNPGRAGDNLLNPLLPQLAFGHALQCVLREMQFHFSVSGARQIPIPMQIGEQRKPWESFRKCFIDTLDLEFHVEAHLKKG